MFGPVLQLHSMVKSWDANVQSIKQHVNVYLTVRHPVDTMGKSRVLSTGHVPRYKLLINFSEFYSLWHAGNVPTPVVFPTAFSIK